MAEKTGAGRQPQEFDAEYGRYLGNNKGYNSQSDINNLPVGHKISLSKQEYGVLRQEVMRKNSRRARLSQTTLLLQVIIFMFTAQ